jgi:uncharacterized membrane protein YdjX (TVP38/TMEM64 family)
MLGLDPGIDPVLSSNRQLTVPTRQPETGAAFVTGRRTDPRRWRRAWITVAVLVLAIALGWHFRPVGLWLGALRDHVIDLGWLGVVAFATVYIGAVVLFAPASVLTIAAGFAYGFWGLPVALTAATAGASLAFLIARHLARDSVGRALARRRNLAAIDQAIATEGWKIVLLLRLNPLVPFNLQNYLLGLTAVPFGSYVAATLVGIAPATAAFVTIGALGEAALDPGGGTWVLLAVGLLATVAGVALVTRKARALLRGTGVAPTPRGDGRA